MITHNVSIDTLINRLENVKQSGRFYRATCPVCLRTEGETKRNLSVRIENGRCKCHKCDARTSDIYAELGITRERQTNPGAFAWQPRPQRTPDAPKPYRDRRQIAAVYDYTDEGGRLLYQKVRFERYGQIGNWYAPKYIVRHLGTDDRWYYGIGNSKRRVLYMLPDLQRAKQIIICEGEKDADRVNDALRAGGMFGRIVATCNFDGASKSADSSKWRPGEYNNAFIFKKRVYILPDNDEAGRNHANQIALSVGKAHPSTDVRIVQLPDLPDGGDVSDYMDAGHDIADILLLAEITPRFDPLPADFFKKCPEELKEAADALLSRKPQVTRKAAPCACGKCGGAAAITIYPNETHIGQFSGANRAECAVTLHRDIKRHTDQVLQEKTFERVYMRIMSHADYVRWTARNKKRKEAARYRPIHLTDDRTILLSTADNDRILAIKDGDELPSRPDAIYDVLSVFLVDSHTERRNRGTADWGHNYMGSKGNGQRKRKSKLATVTDDAADMACIQYYAVNAGVKKVARTIGATIRNGKAMVRAFCIDVEERLSHSSIILKRRGKRGQNMITIEQLAGLQPMAGLQPVKASKDYPLRDSLVSYDVSMSPNGENDDIDDLIQDAFSLIYVDSAPDEPDYLKEFVEV